MHIYAFGSVCRGEIDRGSDIDLLACTDQSAPQIDTEKYSVYQYERLKDLWNEGNPFAWHLHLESKLLFSPDGSDFLKGLGVPSSYRGIRDDLEKFKSLFDRSFQALGELNNSTTFHLSCIFLAIRNYATCYSLSTGSPIFSRRSPLMVTPNLDIDPEAFSVLMRARLLSTRGYGEGILDSEVAATYRAVATVPQWMEALRSQQLDD